MCYTYVLATYYLYTVCMIPLWHPTLARSKRRAQNACSGMRVPNAGGVIVVFGSTSLPILFFCSLQKGSAVRHIDIEFLNKFSSVNSTTIKFVRGQKSEPFSFKEERILEGNLTCPTNLVRPEPFLLQPKKDPELGRSTFWWFHPPFWAHKSSQNPFLFGGKRFQCLGPGNTLTLD